MNDAIKKKLEDNLVYQLDNVNTLAVGGELHQRAIEDIATTAQIIQNTDKEEREILAAKREYKRDTIIKALEVGVSLGTLGLAIGNAVTRDKWIRAGMELEKTGSFTVQTLRTLFTEAIRK